jgi:hypothetical protein
MTSPIAIVTDGSGAPVPGADGHPQERRLSVDATGALRTSGGGGGGGGSSGSVTAAGVNGTAAQAVQGINGGVPIEISGFEPNGQKLLVGTARDRFFDNFNSFDTTDTWELVQTGPGMSITGPLGGAAPGSGPYLNIASGVDVGKTIILSRSSFSLPVELRYQITASQRIAGNRLLVGFVQVDDSGAIITDTTYSTAPEVLDCRNAVFHQHDGTTATTAQLRVRAAGGGTDQVANAFGTGFTTVAGGTAPNFLSATTYALLLERDKINSRAFGMNVLTNSGGQFSYDRLLVNPTRRYKVCIIIENDAVPASSTDWRLHLVNVMDATRFDVSARNAGNTDGAKAFPVWNVGGTTLITTATGGIAVTIAPLVQAETTTNLGANATFTGTTRDGGSTAVYATFNVLGISPQSGTVEVQMGTATPATFVCARQAVVANEPFQIKVPVTARYYRVVFINGATAMTGSAFMINSAFQRAS